MPSSSVFLPAETPDRPPRRVQSQFEVMESSSPAEGDWTSDVYDRLNGSGRRIPIPGPCLEDWSLTRCAILMFSILLVGGGAVLLGLAVRPGLHPTLFPFCSLCKWLTPLFLVIGVVVGCTGIIGLLSAARRRTPVCSAAFAILLLVLSLALLSAGAHLFYMGKNTAAGRENIALLWREGVSHHPSLVCELEEVLKCSGLYEERCCSAASKGSEDASAACYVEDENGTTYDPQSMSVEVTWPVAWCPSGCRETHSKYKGVCVEPIMKMLRESSAHLIIVCWATGSTVAIASACAFFRSTRPPVYRAHYVLYEY